MPRLLVRVQASEAVDAIVATIAKDNLSAALRFYDRVQETACRRGRRAERLTARATNRCAVCGRTRFEGIEHTSCSICRLMTVRKSST